ncbi:MAG: flagellar biosynthesis protein FlgH [Variovorax sp.]|nr:flagellar biosynthesis protein FlgH [Variovorax sp.]
MKLAALLVRLSAAVAVCAVVTGCSTLAQTPQLDMPSTAAPAIVPHVPVAAVRAPTGSLFQSVRYRPLFEDRRARMQGDTVTILIIENVSASQKSTSTIDKKGSSKAGISAFPLISANSFTRASVSGESATDFSGKGGTESANTFQGSITATVVDVQPNGHLVVTGEKQIGVNQNVDVLRFSGTIDPRSIQSGSVVTSTQVANVRIESRGRGAQQESQVMPWLGRFFMNVLPF